MFMKYMPSLIMPLILVTFIFAKCDRNDDPPVEPPVVEETEPTDTTDISKTMLSKVVTTTGSNVTTNTYLYDAQGKLSWISNTSTQADFFEDTSKIIRDANGMITQIVYRSDTSHKYADPKLDSVVFKVFYDATASKYTHKILQYKSFGVNFKDSSVYTYDAQNHISKEESYYYDYKTTKTYIKWAQNDFTYDANGDITKRNTVYYNIDDDKTDYPFDVTYTYHDKGVNLLNLGNEGIVLGILQNFSSHAPKTMIGNYPQSPQYNRNYTYTYTFNTKYRPLRATISDKVTGVNGTVAYSYQ
jgi:hypothetical protein